MSGNEPLSPAKPAAAKLTDSPWFWVYLFSSFAVLALFVIEGKFTRRQDHAENQYLYGTRTLDRPAAATDSDAATAPTASKAIPNDKSGDRAPLTGGPQPLTHPLLISLIPLRIMAFVIMAISCVALQWQLIRNRRRTSAACGKLG